MDDAIEQCCKNDPTKSLSDDLTLLDQTLPTRKPRVAPITFQLWVPLCRTPHQCWTQGVHSAPSPRISHVA
eukprot:7553723-Karenia_brevis.AAC.1